MTNREEMKSGAMPDVYFNKKPKRSSGNQNGNGTANRSGQQQNRGGQQNRSGQQQNRNGQQQPNRGGQQYQQNRSGQQQGRNGQQQPNRSGQQNRNYQNEYYTQYNTNYDHYEDIDSGRGKSRNSRPSASRNANRYYQENAQRRTAQQKNRQPVQQNRQSGAQPPRKKRKGCFRHGCSTAFLAVLLVLILLYVGLANAVFGTINYDPDQHKSNEYISSFSLKKSARVKNILLLGVDARAGDTVSRADTMMLVSIDSKNKVIKLTSFLRDSYVDIPGHGKNKLNAACSYGGIQLVIDTIEYNYKVKIDNYMAVDFTAFTELIDALGGVDVPVTQAEASYMNQTWYKWSLTGNKVSFESGDSVHLNGEKALMFCRIRKLDSDIMRTKRQRLVIEAVKKKVSSLSVTDLFKIAKKVFPELQTDIGKYSMENLSIKALLFYRKYDMEQMAIPKNDAWYDETISGVGEVVAFDVDTAAETLQEYIYDNVKE